MTELGTVTEIRRYPVKSMLGEELREAAVTPAWREAVRSP
jgi:uncharacterized protein YcbX